MTALRHGDERSPPSSVADKPGLGYEEKNEKKSGLRDNAGAYEREVSAAVMSCVPTFAPLSAGSRAPLRLAAQPSSLREKSLLY
jgi:hypothetical protein